MALRQQVARRRSAEHPCRQLDHRQPLSRPTDAADAAAVAAAVEVTGVALVVEVEVEVTQSQSLSHPPAVNVAAAARLPD